jgi:hypothetical protein
MSFGLPYGNEEVPDGVLCYLLPQEKDVITIRYHPAILIWPVFAVLAACVAGSAITVFTDIGGTALIAIWAVAAIACALLAVRVWVWLNEHLVLTRQRVILVPAIIKHRMVSIPFREIRDIYLSRTLPGRLAGYGLLTLAPVREGHAARVIKYIPYPRQIYLEASLLHGEVPG